MSRIVILGGMLASLAAAGATTLAFKSIEPPEVARQRADPAEPIEPFLCWSKMPISPDNNNPLQSRRCGTTGR